MNILTNLATTHPNHQAEEILEAVTEISPPLDATTLSTVEATTTTPANETDFETLFKQIYCNIFNNLERVCKEYSILELWNFNETVIRDLTDEEIVTAVNTIKISPVTGKGC